MIKVYGILVENHGNDVKYPRKHLLDIDPDDLVDPGNDIYGTFRPNAEVLDQIPKEVRLIVKRGSQDFLSQASLTVRNYILEIGNEQLWNILRYTKDGQEWNLDYRFDRTSLTTYGEIS